MLNTKEFLSWFIVKAQTLGVTFNVTPHFKNNDLFHVSLFLKNIQGHATSPNLEEAKLKAMVEFLERYNLQLMHPTLSSNGVACHFLEEKAKANAYSELVERDSFLWHWHHFIAPTYLHSEQKENLEVKYYSLKARYLKSEVFLAILQEPGGLLFLGTATQDQKKAYYEAAANYFSWKINSITPLSLIEFVKLISYGPMDHLRLSLSKESQQKIQDWLLSKKKKSFDHEMISTLEKLSWSPELSGHGLMMYRAVSKNIFNLYWGLPQGSFQNPLPHPLN